MGVRDFKFGSYLKEKVGLKIGDRAANILVDTGYIGNTLFLLPKGIEIAYNFIEKTLSNQPYFDFSTPANSAISFIKAAGSAVTIAITIDGIRTLRGRYPEEPRYKHREETHEEPQQQ